MNFRLDPGEYNVPATIPGSTPGEKADYQKGHRAGWVAFANGIRTTLRDDGYQRGSLAGLGAVRPKQGSEAELSGFDAGFAAASALYVQRVLRAHAERQPATQGWESPIGQPDRLDMVVKRNDGSVGVVIVAARPLDPADPRIARVLEAKLRNYCRYISHPSFAAEFGPPNRQRVKLVLRCNWEVPQAYIQLLAKVAEEEKVAAGLEVRYE